LHPFILLYFWGLCKEIFHCNQKNCGQLIRQPAAVFYLYVIDTAVLKFDRRSSVGLDSYGLKEVNDSIEIMRVVHASKRLYGLAKFTFYAISDGLTEIFSKSYVGLQAFFRPPDYDPQLSLFDCA